MGCMSGMCVAVCGASGGMCCQDINLVAMVLL